MRLHPNRSFKIRSKWGYHAYEVKTILSSILKIPWLPYRGSEALKRKFLKEYWSQILTDADPHFVIGFNLGEEILEHCMRLEIPAVELQHGMMISADEYWPHLTPSAMACWPNTNVSHLEQLGIQIIYVRFPDYFHSLSNLGSRCMTIPPTVLVPLSWGREDSADGFGALPTGLMEYCLAVSPMVASFVFRVHPRFPRRNVAKLIRFLRHRFPNSSQVGLKSRRATDIGEALRNVDLVFSFRSGVAFEAFFAEKPVFVCDDTTYRELRETWPAGSDTLYFQATRETFSSYCKRPLPRISQKVVPIKDYYSDPSEDWISSIRRLPPPRLRVSTGSSIVDN